MIDFYVVAIPGSLPPWTAEAPKIAPKRPKRPHRVRPKTAQKGSSTAQMTPQEGARWPKKPQRGEIFRRLPGGFPRGPKKPRRGLASTSSTMFLERILGTSRAGRAGAGRAGRAGRAHLRSLLFFQITRTAAKRPQETLQRGPETQPWITFRKWVELGAGFWVPCVAPMTCAVGAGHSFRHGWRRFSGAIDCAH